MSIITAQELNNVSSHKNRDFGVRFTITNAKGVKSKLIGTGHLVDKESIQDPAFSECIDRCSVLYSELGSNRFITASHASISEEDHQYWDIPFRYKYDTALTLLAWGKKIPNISLDEGVPFRDREVAEFRETLRKLGVEEFERLTMQSYEMGSDNEKFHQGLYEWKKGNINFFKQIRINNLKDARFKLVNTQREDHWVKILIPKLLETDQPITIAVGALHVVGKDSLSERFERAGLKVEFTSSGPASMRTLPATIQRTAESLPPRSRL